MKLILKKNLEMGGKIYLEGETVDVSADVYAHIMQTYMDERKEMMKAAVSDTVEEHFKFSKAAK